MTKQGTFKKDVEGAIDQWAKDVGVACARTSRRACYLAALVRSRDLKLEEILEKLFQITAQHWNGLSPKGTNWEWRKKPKKFSDSRAEVWLERSIFADMRSLGWTYQIPTSSGFFEHSGGRRRSIDLVHKIGPGHFELIELKNDANNPVSAAFEVALYGIIYLFVRSLDQRLLSHASQSRYDLLRARHIELKVLGPERFYGGRTFEDFGSAMNVAVRDFAKAKNIRVTMSFTFECWPKDFPPWPGLKDQVNGNPEFLRKALDGRASPG